MLAPTRDATKRGILLDQIKCDWEAGRITDAAMLEQQSAVMPLCEYCGKQPSNVIFNFRYCCVDCFLHTIEDTTHG